MNIYKFPYNDFVCLEDVSFVSSLIHDMHDDFYIEVSCYFQPKPIKVLLLTDYNIQINKHSPFSDKYEEIFNEGKVRAEVERQKFIDVWSKIDKNNINVIKEKS